MAKAKTAQKPAKPASKTEAVRQVLAELGKKAPVDAALARVKAKFGHELSKSHFFNIKSVLGLGRGGKRTGRGPGRPRKSAAPTPAPSVASAPRPPRGDLALAIADIALLKELARR